MDIGMKAYETLRGIFQAFLAFVESLLNRFNKLDPDGWIK